MLKKKCVLIISILCIFAVLSSGCSIGDLSDKTTYEGLPVYQFDAENKTVMIDGVQYREIDYLEKVVGTGIKDELGYIWYKPHFEVEDGVVYLLRHLMGYEDEEYLFAESSMYTVGAAKRQYVMLLERVE